ncbi:hypothetical protein WI665_12940 [Vibrio cholerae]
MVDGAVFMVVYRRKNCTQKRALAIKCATGGLAFEERIPIHCLRRQIGMGFEALGRRYGASSLLVRSPVLVTVNWAPLWWRVVVWHGAWLV